jgi:hypothetical protein
MDKQKTIILIIIVILGAFLRSWGLLQVPPGLNWDEVSHGYTAYSLLKTGKDQWNQTLPFFNFRGYGDYPTTLNVYATVVSIALLGPGDFALRIPHAVIGVLTVLAIFVAAAAWKKNINTGLWAALVAAISPWLWFLSRQVLQSNWTVLLVSLALGLLFRRRRWLFAFIMSLALFSYHNARIFVPLFILWNLKWLNKIGIAVILLAAIILMSPASRARNSTVGIVDSGAIAKIEEWRNSTQLPVGVAKIVYNRPVYLLFTTLGHVVDYLNPQFLFVSGGTQYQFSLPKFALIAPILFMPFLIGLFNSSWIVIAGLLFAIVPAAITVDRFAVVRSSIMAPFVFLIISAGIDRLFRYLSGYKRILVAWVGGLTILIFTIFYIADYTVAYPLKYSQSWQYGYKQVVDYARNNYALYDEIVISKRYGEPHEFLLWYWTWDPVKFQNQPVDWDYHDSWYWVNGFDKFKFVNDWDIPVALANRQPDKRYLFFASPESVAGGNVTDTIFFLDGSPAFLVIN